MDRGAWRVTVHGVAKKVGHDLVTKQQQHQQLLFKKKERKFQDGDSRSPNPLGNLSELEVPRASSTDHTPRSGMWVESPSVCGPRFTGEVLTQRGVG